jgi:hypothetical protein
MILKRLDQLEPGQIQNVYDLALMIIDECSSSFLKRPEAEDERPPVVNIFSNTLGFLVGSG